LWNNKYAVEGSTKWNQAPASYLPCIFEIAVRGTELAPTEKFDVLPDLPKPKPEPPAKKTSTKK